MTADREVRIEVRVAIDGKAESNFFRWTRPLPSGETFYIPDLGDRIDEVLDMIEAVNG